MIIRVILNSTMYSNYRATRICKMYGCDADYYYAIKCLMKNIPSKVIAICFIGTLLLFGHALRICERPIDKLNIKD